MKKMSCVPLLVVALVACGSDTPITGGGGGTFALNPCGGAAAGTVTLSVSATTRVDCSGGGTTITLAGGGASYMIVPQFATDAVANNFVSYIMRTGSAAASSLSSSRVRSLQHAMATGQLGSSAGMLPPMRPMAAQRNAEAVLRARAQRRSASMSLRASSMKQASLSRSISATVVPAAGSIRSFHVASSFTTNSYATVGARLSYVGANVLLYIDTLAPANGFTAQQLSDFGKLFDQTLYPIDTTAFGQPVDLDNNGHVIMLMTPVVNGDTPTATCNTQGFVAGFFDSGDFDGPSDPNSNQGEVFYTIVPDPNGTASCAHTVADVGGSVPATFLHELQHLIYFSQHVIVSATGEGSSWMDEGLSIVAEELGSVYYESKCPPPACRTSPAQLFPDSSQGFVQSFLYDSYQYAYLPDTSSVTLHNDSEGGFSWRGGAWLMMRWLGDQFGTSFYKKLEKGPADGLSNIEAGSGQSFPSLFANFGIALYADSLPGLPRATAPAINRFTSRNVKALWAREWVASGSGASSDVPLQAPIQLYPITTDSSSSILAPGTGSYFRLDTPAGSSTVTIQFATPTGGAFATALKAQVAIFRLPAGQ